MLVYHVELGVLPLQAVTPLGLNICTQSETIVLTGLGERIP